MFGPPGRPASHSFVAIWELSGSSEGINFAGIALSGALSTLSLFHIGTERGFIAFVLLSALSLVKVPAGVVVVFFSSLPSSDPLSVVLSLPLSPCSLVRTVSTPPFSCSPRPWPVETDPSAPGSEPLQDTSVRSLLTRPISNQCHSSLSSLPLYDCSSNHPNFSYSVPSLTLSTLFCLLRPISGISL